MTDQTGRFERKVFLVGLGQCACSLEGLVHALANGAVGTVGTDENIAVVGRFVGGADLDTALCLDNVEHTLVE